MLIEKTIIIKYLPNIVLLFSKKKKRTGKTFNRNFIFLENFLEKKSKKLFLFLLFSNINKKK